MAEINQNIYILTGKQDLTTDNTRQDRRKTRQKWGAAETSLLVEGLYEVVESFELIIFKLFLT
jgi:hypothetical protein